MNDLDDNGWGHIHHAAFRGFVKSIERFVHADPEQLEFETGDELHSTPFLLAVTSGSQESVQCLINLDCRVNVVNSQNHGAVELCAMRQYISLLEFLLSLDHPQLPVWKNLLKFLSSESEDEAEAAGRCLRTLTDPSSEGVHANWHPLYMAGGVPTIVKVAKGNIGEEAKIPCTQTLLNVISKEEVQEQAVSAGAVPAYIRLLKAENHFLVQLSAQVLKELARTKSHADLEVQHGVIPAFLKVLQSVPDPEVLVQVIDGLGNVGAADPKHQHAIGSTHQLVPTLVGLFEKTNHPDLLLALTQAVGKIARKEKGNQNAFVNEGITPHLVNVLLQQMRNKEIQLSTVEALHLLAEDNSHSQRAILDKGAERLLMQLLKKSRQEALLERTAMALWALAGDDIEQQCKMADGIGVSTLIEFVNSLSENLHYIGSEGLGVLAQGPLSQQTTIAQANGIHPLVRLLRSDKERIVVSVIRTLRALCVGVGNVPHPRNQATISQSRGIKLLIALMVLPRNEELQVEAALTLGYVSLGNHDILEEILTNVDFSYVRILKMMYADSPMVRLLAGSALAAFAYNNIQQQRDVAEQGGVRFNCFVPFLRSEDEYYRCNAAYQVVVLSRIIPDEEQAKSSAAGIKLLVDLLQESSSEPIQALAADCIARLAHTRAGVPAAIVAIEAVEHLCKLLLSRSEQVRGCAAIALAYLSYNHGAERQLLNKCRTDPYLMRVLKYYTSRTKLSVNFYEGWKHYRRVGLPAIPEGRPSLLRGGLSDVRPATMLSLEDTPEGSNLRSSHSHLEGDVTGRSSRTSRGSRRSRGSHVSHVSQRTTSRGSSIQIEAPASQTPLHNGGGELVTAEEG